MDKSTIQDVCKKVYEQYPIINGVFPDIKPQPNETQLLVFESSGNISNQKAIPINVRVIVNKNGEILKITTSR